MFLKARMIPPSGYLLNKPQQIHKYILIGKLRDVSSRTRTTNQAKKKKYYRGQGDATAREIGKRLARQWPRFAVWLPHPGLPAAAHINAHIPLSAATGMRVNTPRNPPRMDHRIAPIVN